MLSLPTGHRHSGTNVLEEQRQIKTQQGPKKRIFFRYELNSGYSITITKMYLHDKLAAQHLLLIGPKKERMEYHLSDAESHSRLTKYDPLTGDKFTTIGIPAKEAINKILMTSYGLSH